MEEIISVIVPVYNVEKYLNKCVDSIVNQTYKNLEIILVDDGSPDNCPKICDEYAKKDNRIKVIHKENGGLSDARNKGIEVATGKYIGFVDSDDWIDLNMYEELYKVIKEFNASVAVCNILKVKNEDQKINNNKKNNTKVYSQEDYLKKYFKINCQGCEYYACNKLFKSSILETNQFPVKLTSEDVFGTYKALLKSNNIVETNQVNYYYRFNENGITGKFSKKDYDLFKIWDFVVEYTNKNAPEYSEYALLNRKRINFTILYRIAKHYKIKELKKMDIVEKLLSELKRDQKFLLSSPIVLSRKIIIFLFCKNYYITSMLIKMR